MVFCRQCKAQVEDCPHFVVPLKAKRIEVFDPKVKTLAYDEQSRILEISFRNGQTWQLKPVPADIYEELLHQTLSSFLKFIAHRYQSNPVKTTLKNEQIPRSESCPDCKTEMTIRQQTSKQPPARVLWECPSCRKSIWHRYGQESVRERKTRWH